MEDGTQGLMDAKDVPVLYHWAALSPPKPENYFSFFFSFLFFLRQGFIMYSGLPQILDPPALAFQILG
jgi:hypothetical protein